MSAFNMRLPRLASSPVFNFISKRSGPFDGEVTLTRDRVYIVPTKAGFIFALLLFTLLIGSINYEKSLGFVLTFLLVGIGNVALLSTWRNIAGLQLKRTNTAAVFAGETATFSIQLINDQMLNRYSIISSQQGVDHDVIDCAANSQQLINLYVQTSKRGRVEAGRFRLYSEFPTGLFVAWTWVDLSMNCIVYPAADKQHALTTSFSDEGGDDDKTGRGTENFNQLRNYHLGDNIRHISWKALAKSGMLFTKEFTGAKPATQWIDWDEIIARNTEHRLSIMTALVIDAHKHHQHYGIKLPNKNIAPDAGDSHYHQCLTALALY